MGTRRRTTEFRKGDVYRATRDGEITPHIWVVMQDCLHADRHCTRAFNLTGSEAPEGQHMIDVSHFTFPDGLFKYKKRYTYARINEKDCLTKGNNLEYLGDIEDLCPGLMEEVCKQTYACDVALDLDDLCDCNYQIIDKKVDLGQMIEPECDCNQKVYFV